MVTEPRYMRGERIDNIQYATAANIITGSAGGGSFTDMQTSNDVYMIFNAALVGGNQRIVEVEFTGSGLAHVPFVQVKFEGKASSTGVTCELFAYNYDTAAYETTGTMYLSCGMLTTDQVKWLYHVLANKPYRDASGNWKLKVKTTKTGVGDPGFYALYIDHLYFNAVYYVLGTAQSNSAVGNDNDCCGITVGIRIWKVNSDHSETEIDGSSAKATVNGACSTTTLNNTYTPPETADVVAFVVRVYRSTDIMQTTGLDSGGFPLVFMTEDLNDTLLSQQWTVYYPFYYNATFDQTYFRTGTATYNGRITNFGHGTPAPPAAGGILAQVI